METTTSVLRSDSFAMFYIFRYQLLFSATRGLSEHAVTEAEGCIIAVFDRMYRGNRRNVNVLLLLGKYV